MVKSEDLKLKQFIEDVATPIRRQRLKLLIFTEYRATQDYLVGALEAEFAEAVCQINGGMDLAEKSRNIDEFNDAAPFMVSTEAGGEGINLHINCHVLVNYDLPWNPRRLIQRAGRLYRYGQRERVVVFNLMAMDGFDVRALGMLLDRVSQIAHGMSGVGTEFDSGLHAEIVGELLERLDVTGILADNHDMTVERSDDDINEAIRRAEQARERQEMLFSHIEGYDATGSSVQAFGTEDVLSFLEGVLPCRDVLVRRRTHGGRVLELELPLDMRGRFPEFDGRTVVQVTADRRLADRRREVVPMDFASDFFASLVEFAKSPEFGGGFGTLRAPKSGAVGLYRVRWQNDQGVPRWESLVSIYVPADGGPPETNPAFIADLLTKVEQGDPGSPRPAASLAERAHVLERMRCVAEQELASKCSGLRHPNDVVLLAAADLRE